MTTFRYSLVLSLSIVVLGLAGCDKLRALGAEKAKVTYGGCIQTAVGGGTALSAENIRALCSEASGVVHPSYRVENGNLVPTNEFTECLTKKKEELESLKVTDAGYLATLACKYPKSE